MLTVLGFDRIIYRNIIKEEQKKEEERTEGTYLLDQLVYIGVI